MWLAPPDASALSVVAGWSEWAATELSPAPLRAKLDTGADTSSLSAQGVTVDADRTRVRFTLTHSDGSTSQHELPLLRMAHIKRHHGPAQARPVVRMGLCLGGHWRQVEVNLVDRARFEMPLLLGRNFLAGSFLVDADTRDRLPAGCRSTP
jgi:hypothetical protein